jgi:hypothetical protein
MRVSLQAIGEESTRHREVHHVAPVTNSTSRSADASRSDCAAGSTASRKNDSLASQLGELDERLVDHDRIEFAQRHRGKASCPAYPFRMSCATRSARRAKLSKASVTGPCFAPGLT